MICQKCKAENQSGNFCSNCGQRLKEKCSECGQMEQMEWIGRKVCTTKVKGVREKLQEYQNSTVGNWRMILDFLLAIASMTAFGIALVFTDIAYFHSPIANLVTWEMMLSIDLSIIGFFIYLVFKGPVWQRRARDKAQEKFFQIYPDYAELLKKAK